jgi:hypothetical protein
VKRHPGRERTQGVQLGTLAGQDFLLATLQAVKREYSAQESFLGGVDISRAMTGASP